VGGAFGSLHIVLGSASAGFRVFLVEGDAFGFAHEGELYIDAIEEFGRQEGRVGCAFCDGGEFWPVLGDEGGVIDAKAGIEERAGVDEVEDALLFGAHRPWIFFDPFEEAEGFVFVVELVCYGGNGGSTEKIYGLIETGLEGAFDVIGQGYTFFAGRYLGQGTEAFAEPKGEGFGSWFNGISGFGLFLGIHGGAFWISYYFYIVTQYCRE
jgi:hypothetical protein